MPPAQMQCVRTARFDGALSRCPQMLTVDTGVSSVLCARCAAACPGYRKAGDRRRGVMLGRDIFWPEGACFVLRKPETIVEVWPVPAKPDRRRARDRDIARGKGVLAESRVSTFGRATCVRCDIPYDLDQAKAMDPHNLFTAPFDILCRWCAEDAGRIMPDGDAVYLRGYPLFHRAGPLFVHSRNDGLRRLQRKLDKKYE